MTIQVSPITAQKPSVILQDTSLCAIVRDEMTNPAGGIRRFVEAIVPHVEEAVIVDTGSIDGTRQALEELQKDFPNLRVYQKPFEGFAKSRNYALENVRTNRALVLDADERIAEEDIPKLAEFIKTNGEVFGFNFHFIQIYPTGQFFRTMQDCMNPRLFLARGGSYKENPGSWDEDIAELEGWRSVLHRTPVSPVDIIHFLPSKEACENKIKYWYETGNYRTEHPSHSARQYGWKRRNPASELSTSLLTELARGGIK
jgi:glycosyltransferase involved in cell wall biosynthesis